jgi:hypothetical protein
MELVHAAGSPTVIALDDGGAGGNVSVSLRPPVGKEWLVMLGYYYHDEGAAKSCNAQITDGVTTITYQTNSLASDTRVSLLQVHGNSASGAGNLGAWFKLNRDKYIIVNATALTAGKKLYVRAFVLEIRQG